MNIKVVTTEVTCPNCGSGPGQPCRSAARRDGTGRTERAVPHASRNKVVPATKSWVGPAPTNCDLCSVAIKDTFVDGRTVLGPWGNMCTRCHRDHGAGLGAGLGQKYRRETTVVDIGVSFDRWWKVAG